MGEVCGRELPTSGVQLTTGVRRGAPAPLRPISGAGVLTTTRDEETEMASGLEKTTNPGIFRRHATDCGKGRCSCPYVVIWRHRGRQHKATFRSLAEAREAKGNRDAGDRRPVSRVSFEDYYLEWIESYTGRTARGFSETSRSLYRRYIEDHARRRWGKWKLAEVEPTDVRTLYTELRARGVSTSGMKGLRAALSAMYATAVEDGLVRANPIQGVRIPAPADHATDEESDAKSLTRTELALVLQALPEDWRLFFEFLTHTGLRISEAVGLTWEHVELDSRPRILVREQVYNGKRRRLKTRQGRRDIPLSTGMAERLRAHRRDTYRGDRAPVFATDVGTELSRPNLAIRVLKPSAVAAGLGEWVEREEKRHPESWVSFHTFRHTCASLLIEDGRNVKQVAGWLGHADPAYTLRRYVHLLDDGVGDADFLDDVVTADPAQGNAGATQRPEKAANQVAA